MAYISTNYRTNDKAPLTKWICAPTSTLGPYDEVPPENTRSDPNYCGQCVSFVKQVCPTLPKTTTWKKGAAVKGNANIVGGTVIATFDSKGNYLGHAAIYVSQTSTGMEVYDQWVNGSQPKAAGPRTIRFGGGADVNNGDKYYVVD